MGLSVFYLACARERPIGEISWSRKSTVAIEGLAEPFLLESFYDNEETRELLWTKVVPPLEKGIYRLVCIICFKHHVNMSHAKSSDSRKSMLSIFVYTLSFEGSKYIFPARSLLFYMPFSMNKKKFVGS